MLEKIAVLSLVFFFLAGLCAAGEPSADTETCLECHQAVHPGLVGDWLQSRHSRTTPQEALEKPEPKRRLSASGVPEDLRGKAVGCAECHTLRPEAHKDTFEHNGYQVHVVVTPADCAACHPEERGQYSENIMSRAYGNLMDNPVYSDLALQTNGIQVYDPQTRGTRLEAPDSLTEGESCLYCHGTRVEVKGAVTRESDFGEFSIPVLAGWPNQGVGRLNPDDSRGSCTACHPRHSFSIETARKPHTCSQCHKGPDVPGSKVYEVSKHGNIYSSMKNEWDFDAVPWALGRDFQAPTCAGCHISLVVDLENNVVAKRTHQMSDRLSWRLFGVYSHPHPASPDTTKLKNRAGLPLPVDLDGTPAPEGLIGPAEQSERRAVMSGICGSCHGTGWVENHFTSLDRTIAVTNEMTLAATRIMITAWKNGVARGLDQNDSLFNEALEKMWVEQWLFYANSTRYASAMLGADYGVFENGRWVMSRNIQDMLDRLNARH